MSFILKKGKIFAATWALKRLLNQDLAQITETTLEHQTRLPLIGPNCIYLIIYER